MSCIEAINGLLVSSDHMSVISNNIANASTTGFKSSTPSFYNITSNSFESQQSLNSGVGTSHIIQNFNNGVFVDTGRDLDLSIVGDGFFRIADENGRIFYTRNGQFMIDRNQNMINTQEMYLTGKSTDYSYHNINSPFNLDPINFKNANKSKEKSTDTIQLNTILYNRAYSLTHTYDASVNITDTGNYNVEKTIYDKNTEPRKLNITFRRVKLHEWLVDIDSDDNINYDDEEKIKYTCQIKFDSEGKLNDRTTHFNIPYNNIHLDFTGTKESSHSESKLIKFSQNGYLPSSLKTLEITQDGKIHGYYSNNTKKDIGHITLSKFINPEQLKPESGNLWSATKNAGQEDIGFPGDVGFGKISPKTLENSNVDLNKELINMITAQRDYQSNAQAFKAEDKIIKTLVDLK